MKSAFVICSDSVDLLDILVGVGGSLGLDVCSYDRSVQLTDDMDRRLGAFAVNMDVGEWWPDDMNSIDLKKIVSVITPKVYLVESRWGGLFCTVFVSAGIYVDVLLVVDGNGVLYRATELDPSTIQL